MKNFGTGSQKIYFWNVHERLFRDFFSRFLIPCDTTAVEVFEVWSVAMTSSPELVGIEKISSIVGFQDPLNSVLNSVLSYGLRAFASLGRIDALDSSGPLNLNRKLSFLHLKGWLRRFSNIKFISLELTKMISIQNFRFLEFWNVEIKYFNSLRRRCHNFGCNYFPFRISISNRTFTFLTILKAKVEEVFKEGNRK